MTEPRRGFSLLEMLIVLAIVGIVVAVSTPNFVAIRRGREIRLESSELRNIFQYARATAIARGIEIGVRFTKQKDRWTYAFYKDGDGDGIRTADITAGIDRRIPSPPSIPEKLSVARIGLPSVPIYEPDSSDIVQPDESPIRFGTSSICSFSPLGSATSGSVYITDGLNSAAAVRVLGSTGRVRVVICKLAVVK